MTAASSSMTSNQAPQVQTKREGVARPVANLGNTCYMNAVLQALAHAPDLCNAMDCESHRANCPVANENRLRQRALSPNSSSDDDVDYSRPIRKQGVRKSSRVRRRKSPPSNLQDEDDFKFCALCEVEYFMQTVHATPPPKKAAVGRSSPTQTREKPVTPMTFVHGFIDHVAPWFRLGVQEDSHEFLRLLIDAMQRSCKEARITTKQDAEKKNSTDRDEDVEYPFSLFRGTVESNVRCASCNASSSKLDPIEDIGLEVTPPQSNGCGTEPAFLSDVSTAFHRFAQVEQLDAEYKCENCGKLGSGTKQSRLSSIPPILTLHLKRFRYGSSVSGGNGGSGSADTASAAEPTGMSTRRATRSEVSQLMGSNDGHHFGKSGSSKIEGHIKFDMVIDLRPFLTQELQDKHKNNGIISRLFAVIVHSGKNSHSGHYVAYVRNIKKNAWYKMDDARVTHVSFQEVMNAEAYMLFYRVVDHPVTMQLKSKIDAANNAIQKQEQQLAQKCDAVEAETKTCNSISSGLDIKQEVGKSISTSVDKSKTEVAPTRKGENKNQKSTAANNDKSKSKNNTNNVKNGNGKKRKAVRPPQFPNGESWACAKTRLSSDYYPLFSKVEDYISENVELSPAFFKVINDEASKANAKVGHGPNAIIGSDDIVGGYKNYKAGLKELLFHLFTHFNQKNNVNGEHKDLSFFLPDSNKKLRLDKKLIEVVDAADETLL